ncbi:SDR family NAD(P)-dependent oxidoreductase [Kribbella sp. VKM Ac-2568]|uniref:SDR family NAD(P)-dependent oxidoreductase n=1 Tax=Kribbella sp. VKM Ac-2568 TaxID=2512219 RepID=UPI00104E8001|nr:SDR family oxidoreductase [Kribbella sp. VKM Ac-2568]TCM51205.1 NAD(P)-dependent dehydrogenase (short-subunit alcohol dehydrogenase family) [Kribbella sp. VKM Ac-2568]
MGQLDNKVALVTGATSGIGLAAARRLAVEGAHVFITGRRKPELDAAVADIAAVAGDRVTGVAGDVANLDDLDALYSSIAQYGRGLDIVYANAGGGGFVPLEAITPDDFDRTFGINVRGTLFTVQKALPLLNEGAAIVLAGSTAATDGTPAFSVYSATKAAIRSFGRTWAAELAPRGIRVNTVIPGSTNTPGLAGLVPDPEQVGAVLGAMAAGVPLGRLGEPDEIANAVLFLASDQSSFMTGGEIFVDGGSSQI